MMARVRFFFLLLSGLLACGSSEPDAPASPAPTAAGPGKLDPASFDCRAPAAPARRSAVPPACATDRACTTRMVCAHRGAGGDLGVIAPENTLSAVRAAIALGIEFIETDPRPTKDGVLVNVHDTDVERVTTGKGNVADMTLAEVQALPLRISKYPGDFACERVATIEEVLTLARGRIHVLLDANKTDDVAGLVELVRKTDTLDWAIFDTDSVDKIDKALAIEPRLLTMIRVASKDDLDAELAHFSAHPPVLVEINGNASIKELAPLIRAAGHRAFTDAFGYDLSAGLQDRSDLYDEVWALGVDVLQTDRPDLVLRGLKR